MKRRATATAMAALVLVAGCSSSGSKSATSSSSSPSPASTGTQTASSQSSSSAPSSASTGAKAGTLTISGSVSFTAKERADSSDSCKPAQGTTSGILAFESDGDGVGYELQFFLPSGTTAFPAAPGAGLVSLYDGNDSSRQWSIGTSVSSTQSGIVTFDGSHGTVDVDMVPDTPRPNSTLAPIHVKGSFDC